MTNPKVDTAPHTRYYATALASRKRARARTRCLLTLV